MVSSSTLAGSAAPEGSSTILLKPMLFQPGRNLVIVRCRVVRRRQSCKILPTISGCPVACQHLISRYAAKDPARPHTSARQSNPRPAYQRSSSMCTQLSCTRRPVQGISWPRDETTASGPPWPNASCRNSCNSCPGQGQRVVDCSQGLAAYRWCGHDDLARRPGN